MMTKKNLTLGDVIAAVAEVAESDAEVAATVAYMIQRGTVRFRGRLAGARISFEPKSLAVAKAA